MEQPRREATWLNLGDESYIASGGMSWGDSPTDTYDYIVAWDMVAELLVDKPY